MDRNQYGPPSPAEKDKQQQASADKSLLARRREQLEALKKTESKSALDQATGAGGLTTAAMALGALLLGEEEAATGLALGGLAGSFAGADKYNQQRKEAISEAQDAEAAAMKERDDNLMDIVINNPRLAQHVDDIDSMLGFGVTGPIGTIVTKEEEAKKAELLIGAASKMADRKQATNLMTRGYRMLGFTEDTARTIAVDIIANSSGKEAYERILNTKEIDPMSLAKAEDFRLSNFEDPESEEAYRAAIELLRGKLTTADIAKANDLAAYEAKREVMRLMREYLKAGDSRKEAFERVALTYPEATDRVIALDQEWVSKLEDEAFGKGPDVWLQAYDSGLKYAQEKDFWEVSRPDPMMRARLLGREPQNDDELDEIKNMSAMEFNQEFAEVYADLQQEASDVRYEDIIQNDLDRVIRNLEERDVPPAFTNAQLSAVAKYSTGFDRMTAEELEYFVLEEWNRQSADLAEDVATVEEVVSEDGAAQPATSEEEEDGQELDAEQDSELKKLDEQMVAELEAVAQNPGLLPGMEESEGKRIKEKYDKKKEAVVKQKEYDARGEERRRQDDIRKEMNARKREKGFYDNELWIEENFSEKMDAAAIDVALVDRMVELLWAGTPAIYRLGKSNEEFVEELRGDAQRRLQEAKARVEPGNTKAETALRILRKAEELD